MHTFPQSVYRMTSVPWYHPRELFTWFQLFESSILLFTLHEGERYKDDKENKSEKLYRVNPLPFYYFSFPFPNHAKGSQRILGIPLFNDRAGLKLEGCSLSFRHLISARFVIFQYIYRRSGQTVIEDNAERLQKQLTQNRLRRFKCNAAEVESIKMKIAPVSASSRVYKMGNYHNNYRWLSEWSTDPSWILCK